MVYEYIYMYTAGICACAALLLEFMYVTAPLTTRRSRRSVVSSACYVHKCIRQHTSAYVSMRHAARGEQRVLQLLRCQYLYCCTSKEQVFVYLLRDHVHALHVARVQVLDFVLQLLHRRIHLATATTSTLSCSQGGGA